MAIELERYRGEDIRKVLARAEELLKEGRNIFLWVEDDEIIIKEVDESV